MMEMLDIGIDRAVAIRVSGKISGSDMEAVFSQAKEKIARFGSIVVFEQIDSFTGVELAGIKEEFHYLREMGLANIDKVAVVTDKKWIEVIANIEDKLFRSIDIECFSLQQKDAAIAYLAGN